MPSNRKILHEGRYWVAIPAAARLLHTSVPKIREAMGRGDLEWTQIKLNGKPFVGVESLHSYGLKLLDAKSAK